MLHGSGMTWFKRHAKVNLIQSILLGSAAEVLKQAKPSLHFDNHRISDPVRTCYSYGMKIYREVQNCYSCRDTDSATAILKRIPTTVTFL